MNYSIEPQFCMPLDHLSVFLATWTVQHLTRRFQPWDVAVFFFSAWFNPPNPPNPRGLEFDPKILTIHKPHYFQLFSSVFICFQSFQVWRKQLQAAARQFFFWGEPSYGIYRKWLGNFFTLSMFSWDKTSFGYRWATFFFFWGSDRWLVEIEKVIRTKIPDVFALKNGKIRRLPWIFMH